MQGLGDLGGAASKKETTGSLHPQQIPLFDHTKGGW